MAEDTPDKHSVLHTHIALDPVHQEVSHPPQSYTYYHAGPLFTLAELHTNKSLSNAISAHSSGKFIPILPQDLEQRDTSPHSIRDQDIRALLSCDLALFTYDGVELDAGTVVEYMIAKMADIPAVILRTDFRRAGDQAGRGDSWNLMSSFWPRTAGVTVDGMVGYKIGLEKALQDGNSRQPGEFFLEEVAEKVVNSFETVLQQPSRLPKELRESVYRWLALMPGFKNGGDTANVQEILRICKDKQAKGLL